MTGERYFSSSRRPRRKEGCGSRAASRCGTTAPSRGTPEGSSHSTRSTPKDLESPRIGQTRRVAKARRVYLGIMFRDHREKPSSCRCRHQTPRLRFLSGSGGFTRGLQLGARSVRFPDACVEEDGLSRRNHLRVASYDGPFRRETSSRPDRPCVPRLAALMRAT